MAKNKLETEMYVAYIRPLNLLGGIFANNNNLRAMLTGNDQTDNEPDDCHPIVFIDNEYDASVNDRK